MWHFYLENLITKVPRNDSDWLYLFNGRYSVAPNFNEETISSYCHILQ